MKPTAFLRNAGPLPLTTVSKPYYYGKEHGGELRERCEILGESGSDRTGSVMPPA